MWLCQHLNTTGKWTSCTTKRQYPNLWSCRVVIVVLFFWHLALKKRQSVKNNNDFKTTPVIMLSSKDGLFDRAMGRIVDSEQYLTKPFSKDELLSAIRDHVKVMDSGQTGLRSG